MESKLNFKRYYLDVCTLAFSAFGGPQAHIAMLFDLFAEKRKYVTTEELVELNALCSFLPGPTSTQTIIATGYKLGGIRLGLITFLIWVMPAAIVMVSAVFLMEYLAELKGGLSFTIYLQAAAIGLIINAALTIYKKVVKVDFQKSVVFLAGLLTFCSMWWLSGSLIASVTFPIVLLIGALIGYFKGEENTTTLHQKVKIKWGYLVLCVLILVLAVGSINYTSSEHALIFEKTYRNGLFIYGGGQVLMPLLHTEFVDQSNLLSSQEFFSGMGLASGVPGPMFSIAGFLGTMSIDGGILAKVGGGLLGLLGIFLPGVLLIFFVAPFWEQIKGRAFIQKSFKGVNAAACGLIMASVPLLFIKLPHDFSWNTLIISAIALGTFSLAKWKVVPVPAIIAVCLVVGLIIPPIG